MDVVVVIPARGGSKGLPRKNLQPIGGIPLIGWAVRAARSAKCVTAVYVSTEDAEIASVARGYGAEIIDRPAALADDATMTLPVLRHALDWLESPPERIVCLQCTNPLTTGDDIDQAVAKAEATDADVVVSVTMAHSFLLRERPSTGAIVPINFDADDVPRRQDITRQWRMNGTITVLRTSGLSSAASIVSGRVAVHEMPAERSIDIDTPLDMHIGQAMHEYQRQWIVLGSSPSAPEWLPVVRARYPAAVTITTNAGGRLFEPPDRPDFYFLSDHVACEEHGELAQDMAACGSRTITLDRCLTSLKDRGVEWFDEFINDEREEAGAVFHPNRYVGPGLSGLYCLQYAANHGACGIHMIGFEGYGDGRHYWDKPRVQAQNKSVAYTKSMIRPFVQSVVDTCPDVAFSFYGDLNYRISGENVRCDSSS